MSASATTQVEQVLLNPRPLARFPASFPLLPLLPVPPQSHPLPPEIWSRILELAFEYHIAHPSLEANRLKSGLLVVSKQLNILALPLFYANVHIRSLPALEKFVERLQTGERHWDSIRRIPYSAPGRWVQDMDLQDIKTTLSSEEYYLDHLLTLLFPLIPFLARLTLNPMVRVSQRAMTSLAERDGIGHFHSLRGVELHTLSYSSHDPFIHLLRSSRNLQELEISGKGITPTEYDSFDESALAQSLQPLDLPNLRKLVLLSMPGSPIMLVLLHSSLPALRHLVITPYDTSMAFVAKTIVPQFIEAHGHSLTSLHLYTPQAWPSIFSPTPPTLLDTCPHLQHLSLEKPLPQLTIAATSHSLRILSIPRPRADFYHVLESLLPRLPMLTSVRARDVRWLRSGMSSRALEAGVQGEMMEWRRKLARRRIRMLDADWKDGADHS